MVYQSRHCLRQGEGITRAWFLSGGEGENINPPFFSSGFARDGSSGFMFPVPEGPSGFRWSFSGNDPSVLIGKASISLRLSFQGLHRPGSGWAGGKHTMGLLGKVVVAKKAAEHHEEKKEAKEAKKKEEEKK
jgi:hypothetical protein